MEQFTFEQLPKAVFQLYEKLNAIEALLLNQELIVTTESDQLLTVKQAATLLNLSVPTIYGLVQRREIPVSKRGKRLYFSKQELTNWIKAGRKLTISEIDSEAENFLKGKTK